MDLSFDPNKSQDLPALMRLQRQAKKILNPATLAFETREYGTTVDSRGQQMGIGDHDDIPISAQFNEDAFEKGTLKTGQDYSLQGFDFQIEASAEGQMSIELHDNASDNAKKGGYTILLIPKGQEYSAQDIQIDPSKPETLKANISNLPEGEYHPVMIPTINRDLAVPLKVQLNNSQTLNFNAVQSANVKRQLGQSLAAPQKRAA